MADDSIEDRLAKMEQRIRYLEERVASQDQVIVEKERQISALSAGEGDAWYNRVEIGGAIELEADHKARAVLLDDRHGGRVAWKPEEIGGRRGGSEVYRARLDGFVLVSSDSDFTRLAQRLREGGFAVFGFGESRTPRAFRSACQRFEIVGKVANRAAAAPGRSG